MFDIVKLIAGGLLGALVMAGVEEYRMSARVSDAVAAEVKTQVTICEGRLAQQANAINAHSDEVLDQALDASRSLGRTPIDQAELQDVCDAEPACRDRKVVKK